MLKMWNDQCGKEKINKQNLWNNNDSASHYESLMA